METSAKYSIITKQIQPVPLPFRKTKTKPLPVTFKLSRPSSSSSSSSRKDAWTPSPAAVTPSRRRRSSTSPPKTRRRLITIGTSTDWKWSGNWTSDYTFSLDEFRLGDLADDGHKDTQVLITLTVEKHASFGLSVHGRIITSFLTKCTSCSSSYSKEINTTFDVWILQSSRDNYSDDPLPDIGGEDPSVIYVMPGCEAELDTLIQDTIRLATSVKETCSEKCEKSDQIWQYISTKDTSPSVDGRWSALLKLRKKGI